MGSVSGSFSPFMTFYVNIQLLLLISCFTFHCGAQAQTVKQPVLGNSTDHQALAEFKSRITSDPLQVLSSWNHSVHFCQWHGVTCSRRHQRVVELKLVRSQLMGPISPHLGNLSFLRVLILLDNSFSGEVPQEVWSLGRLEWLDVANNSIVGTIPSNISCSSKLKALYLGGNHLSGQIPGTISCFSHLQILNFLRNQLTGAIPSSLGNLSSLTVLELGFNNLTGTFPEPLGQLKNLTILAVAMNELSGSIPPSVSNLSNLRTFSVANNLFEASLPADIGTAFPFLRVLYVNANQFSGKIPPSLSNATGLTNFAGGINNFHGSVPSDLSKLNSLQAFGVEQNLLGTGGETENDLNFLCSMVNATASSSLYILSLGSNNFGGTIPDCLGNISENLNLLGLESNRIWGSIPSTIGNLISLEMLSLFENQLSGEIPSSIGRLTRLMRLYLRTNNLSGAIPVTVGNLTSLTELALGSNNFNGSIPPELGGIGSLIALDVTENQLSGSIPPQLFNLSPFSIALELFGNRLTGEIPSQVGSLKRMGELDVSRNSLSGEIPATLGDCESLELLDLSGNFLNGTIPPSLSSLRGLDVLNFSHNRLSGEVPTSLVSLRLLKSLDLSYNDLGGIVSTQGIFSNASVVTLTGNHKLCGGIPELHLQKCKSKTNMNWKIILLIVSLAFGAVLLACAMLYWWLIRRKRVKLTARSNSQDHQFIELSYIALFRATNGFSSTNLIGAGSLGAVYRGVLDDEGMTTTVAIKVFNLLQRGASKSFMAECEALRNIRHRNVLKVLTACSSIDGDGKDFKALVYEFMSNGSLEQWIHHTDDDEDTQRSPKVLTFHQRLSIVIDVASALEYLHQYCETPIVHCDLKPSNVLLDDDLTAHLGDFGLVRFLGTISGENETSSIAIRGSIGYTPPEYGIGGEVSTCGDMYSYGVLLLEIFTGKRPTDKSFHDGVLNLHQLANRALIEGAVMEIIDPVLLHDIELARDVDGTDLSGTKKFGITLIQECLASIIGIGVACSVELPKERLCSSDVVRQLSSIRDQCPI